MPPASFSPTQETLRRRAKDRRRREVQRRRASALVVIALIVLAISIAIGDIGGTSQRQAGAHVSLSGPARLRAVAELARRRTAAENRAIDRIMTYTPFVTSGGKGKREVALTFDDGPGPYTPQVLRVLRRLKVKATFFEVGFMERWFHSSTAQALREGHTIGDHTESHPKLGLLPRPAQRNQIVSQADWLNRLGAPEPRLFRPPFGSFNGNTFTVLRRNGMLMVLWSVDSQDYRQPGATVIVQRVLRGA